MISAIVPVPPTSVQVPTPGVEGRSAAILVLLTGSQNDWSGPASASGAFGSNTDIVTTSEVIDGSQGPLLVVHCRILFPCARSVTEVFGSLISGEVLLLLGVSWES